MPDRHLIDAVPGEIPAHTEVQQLIEAERGLGVQGVRRAWQASDSSRVVLTSDASGVKISRDNGTTAPSQVIVDGTPAGGQLSGTYPNPSLSTATIDALVPPGTIAAFGGALAPAGWLPCNGTAVSRTTYAKLFAAIGTAYGAGDGSTTFGLPNLLGRVLLGAGGAHPLGQVGGAETAPGPAHTHPGSHGHGQAGHTHGQADHLHGQADHLHGQTSHAHVGGSHIHGASALGVNGTTAGPSATSLRADGPNPVAAESHTHAPGSLGVTGTTDAPPSYETGGVTAGVNTGGVTAGVNTGGMTTAPTTGATAPATTDSDSTAHAASYPSSIPTMMPFGVGLWIIRAGS